eukprot:scaffold10798_cov46-Attheya_sp.AAC.2
MDDGFVNNQIGDRRPSKNRIIPITITEAKVSVSTVRQEEKANRSGPIMRTPTPVNVVRRTDRRLTHSL